MAESYRRSRWSNALFILPYMVVFLSLLVFPLIWGMWLSLNKTDLFGGARFIGLKNYVRVFSDPVFGQAVWNTVIFVLISVPDAGGARLVPVAGTQSLKSGIVLVAWPVFLLNSIVGDDCYAHLALCLHSRRWPAGVDF